MSPRLCRREFLGALGTPMVAGLAGCSGRDGSGPRKVAMTDGFAFDPATVSIDVGATVTWRNTGGIDHTVTAYADGIPTGADYFASGSYDSESAARSKMSPGLVGPDESFTHTFDVAGRYEYFCIPHESAGMTGMVRVG